MTVCTAPIRTAFRLAATVRARPTTFTSVRTFAASARLDNTLAVLEHRDGELQARSLNVVTAAAKFGQPVTAFLAGTEAKDVAAKVAKLQGVDKVMVVANGAYDKVSEGEDIVVQNWISDNLDGLRLV